MRSKPPISTALNFYTLDSQTPILIGKFQEPTSSETAESLAEPGFWSFVMAVFNMGDWAPEGT